MLQQSARLPGVESARETRHKRGETGELFVIHHVFASSASGWVGEGDRAREPGGEIGSIWVGSGTSTWPRTR